MAALRVLEVLFFVAVAFFVVVEVILPAVIGAPLFPSFRYRRVLRERDEVVAQNIEARLRAEIEAERHALDHRQDETLASAEVAHDKAPDPPAPVAQGDGDAGEVVEDVPLAKKKARKRVQE